MNDIIKMIYSEMFIFGQLSFRTNAIDQYKHDPRWIDKINEHVVKYPNSVLYLTLNVK